MITNTPTEQLPQRTVMRLSEYRRTLDGLLRSGLTHIYSHQLAEMHGITAVQVRRDLMLIGFSSASKKGYEVQVLSDFIASILDSDRIQNVAIIGMGNLAQAITHYFSGKRSKLNIAATFDVDPEKVGAQVAGIPCYDIAEFGVRVKESDIKIVVLSCPSSVAAQMVVPITDAGIRGVLNFTSTPLNFPIDIYVEDYDMITILEKVAYFSR